MDRLYSRIEKNCIYYVGTCDCTRLFYTSLLSRLTDSSSSTNRAQRLYKYSQIVGMTKDLDNALAKLDQLLSFFFLFRYFVK